MKKIFLIAIAIIVASAAAKAQDRKESLERDGFYTRETMPARVPVPYQFVREADVLWSKRIWRVIDLRQKMNYPLYYPTVLMQDRESLVQRLVRAIKYNEINAYDPIDDEFTTRMTYEQVLEKLDAKDRIEKQLDEDGNEVEVTIKGQIRWNDIKELLIKEDWFFDKQRSVMEVRIIGICPIMHRLQILNTGGDEEQIGQLQRIQTFWVYFPEARNVLANTDVFNNFNDAQRISFDDIFWKRRFDSYIIRESNVWDNRLIQDYTFSGLETLLESERIKTDIFNFEHDLWEY
ncbi:type IX secretion system ring subunit PorN/GldN [Tenuifilum thalassicum]|uniref:Gliding motility protein GldN n=1 Tax=Tenuifilum thalassicum TaxID=2590900 RepID=A0A7D3XKU0_9BACT|nr:gliding motility protein GldN [Tenuifilum thalassicum]QKG78856.1 gliding motility protein GldN [Tenuifilum thalassicum]